MALGEGAAVVAGEGLAEGGGMAAIGTGALKRSAEAGAGGAFTALATGLADAGLGVGAGDARAGELVVGSGLGLGGGSSVEIVALIVPADPQLRVSVWTVGTGSGMWTGAGST